VNLDSLTRYQVGTIVTEEQLLRLSAIFNSASGESEEAQALNLSKEARLRQVLAII
jgi:hypothetical protein